MSGLSITHLPLPERRFDPALAPEFETAAQVRAEDAARAKSLARSANTASRSENRASAQALSLKLGSVEDGSAPVTPASATFMREHRRRIGGALWRLAAQAAEPPAEPVCLVTILRPDWEVFPSQLLIRSPSSIWNSLRGHLYACGAKHSTGALFAGIHGEHEPRSQKLRLHVHGIATGEMIKVVHKLKKLDAYRPVQRRIGEVEKRVPAVRVRRITADAEGPFTYAVQSFWPSRWEGVVDGKIRRQRWKARIAEPVHTQVLVWLDRFRLPDLTLLVGLKVTREGLIRTKQAQHQ